MAMQGRSGAEVLWELTPATDAKHRLYKRYLDAWWPIMLQRSVRGFLRRRVTYLDAFAGPGRYLGGEEGSPLFALGRLLDHDAAERMFLSRERVSLVFMEKDRRRDDATTVGFCRWLPRMAPTAPGSRVPP
jgi:three-Cys-motif partner protein